MIIIIIPVNNKNKNKIIIHNNNQSLYTFLNYYICYIYLLNKSMAAINYKSILDIFY